MDPHLFSLLDPDPGGKNLREKNRKMQGKFKENLNFIIKYYLNVDKTPLFMTLEQSFWFISTLIK